MLTKSEILKRSCAFALSVLGVSTTGAMAIGNTKVVEGFKLQDSYLSVYGGQDNYITATLYGTVVSSKTKGPLQGIKVAIYDGTRERAVAFTDEQGSFYFEGIDLWAGVGVDYTMIVSDPKKEHKALRRDLSFEIDDVSREEFVILEAKK